MSKIKRTTCPSPAYKPYKPDAAMRIAAERAAKDQPRLTTLSSNVPAYTKER